MIGITSVVVRQTYMRRCVRVLNFASGIAAPLATFVANFRVSAATLLEKVFYRIRLVSTWDVSFLLFFFIFFIHRV